MSYERKIGKRYFSCGWKKGFGIGFSIDKYLIYFDLGIVWVGLEL